MDRASDFYSEGRGFEALRGRLEHINVRTLWQFAHTKSHLDISVKIELYAIFALIITLMSAVLSSPGR